MRERTATTDELTYLHGDHLGSASLATDASGGVVSEMRYYPYGETRSGTLPTDYQFTHGVSRRLRRWAGGATSRGGPRPVRLPRAVLRSPDRQARQRGYDCAQSRGSAEFEPVCVCAE